MAEARQSRERPTGLAWVTVILPRNWHLASHWVEFLGALLMSLAALLSAWCAYRASVWASNQSSYTLTMSRNAGLASTRENTAVQQTAFDAGMFIQYAEAVLQSDENVSDFLYERFRPEMRVAVDAWLATNPLTNPDAPSSPLVMPEYVLAARQEGNAFRAQAQEAEISARAANDRSTQYVGFTTMAATALFLGGITTKFPTLKIRNGLLVFAWIVLLATAGYMIVYTVSLTSLAAPP